MTISEYHKGRMDLLQAIGQEFRDSPAVVCRITAMLDRMARDEEACEFGVMPTEDEICTAKMCKT